MVEQNARQALEIADIGYVLVQARMPILEPVRNFWLILTCGGRFWGDDGDAVDHGGDGRDGDGRAGRNDPVSKPRILHHGAGMLFRQRRDAVDVAPDGSARWAWVTDDMYWFEAPGRRDGAMRIWVNESVEGGTQTLVIMDSGEGSFQIASDLGNMFYASMQVLSCSGKGNAFWPLPLSARWRHRP